MNLRKRKTHRVSSPKGGWTANTLCFAVAGEAFVLTSPFIERDYRKVGNLRSERPRFRVSEIFPYANDG